MGKAVRLDKFLADAGAGTRSEVKKYIQKGKGRINGVPAKKSEIKVSEEDEVVLDGNRIKTYLKNSLYPLMEMFGKNNMPKIDEHLTNYYQLTDEGRNDVDQFIKAQLQIKKDPERAADVKKITKW